MPAILLLGLLLLRALLCACAPPRELSASPAGGGRMRRLMERSGISRSWMGVARAAAASKSVRHCGVTHPLQVPLASKLASFPILSRQRERGLAPSSPSAVGPDLIRASSRACTTAASVRWLPRIKSGVTGRDSIQGCIKFTPHSKTGSQTRRRPLNPPSGVSTSVNRMGRSRGP